MTKKTKGVLFKEEEVDGELEIEKRRTENRGFK